MKNVGEIPYENQHLMSTTLPVEFKHGKENVRGFVFVNYWVETDPNIVGNMSSHELSVYLSENGQLYLDPYRDEIIEKLKTYSLKEIRENWYSDWKFFASRDIYFIKNDRHLEKFLKKLDLKLNIPFQYKKVFFVYLDKETFKKFESESKLN